MAPEPNRPFATGMGYDLHRIEPRTGGRLIIGGVTVAEGVAPIAHSDGDVLLHALVDALLGAAGLGDIGEHFSNKDLQWAGANSSLFVTHAMGLLKQGSWTVGNVDTLVIAERPKLAPHKSAMRQIIAGLVGVSPSQVNIKAGTNEGVDALGQGLAVAAHATVLLFR